MPHEITIPRLGWSMEEGKFVGWKKRDGDLVRAGDPLFELEGEKAVQDIEAVDAGVLRIPPDGPAPDEVVAVGQIIGYLLAPGEAAPWATAATPPSISPATNSPLSSPMETTVSLLPLSNESAADLASDRPRATPRARRAARSAGVDLNQVAGSGRGRRIRERDVLAAASAQVLPAASPLQMEPDRESLEMPAEFPMSGEASTRPLSALRRTIANRLQRSRQETVPVTLHTRADAGNLVGIRDQFKAAARHDANAVIPSYTDLIVKLSAAVLVGEPLFAARWSGEQLVYPSTIDIGIAVDAEEGLVVPVVRDVARLRLTELAQATGELVSRARSRRLTADQLQGACFTVTNLGGFGIDAFTPVIHWPETAILGLGAIRREPVVVGEDRIEPRWQMWLSLTFDHRAADGAPAARFLQKIRGAIENPAAWLIG